MYWESPQGITLETACPVHGVDSELVERDARFFREAYEYDGYASVPHLFMPVTYRCNLACRYCYTHSNYPHPVPPDRPISRIVDIATQLGCATVNLAGGEPTVRDDLPQLIRALKDAPAVETVCVVSNGQRLADPAYMSHLRDHGLNFLSLPLYIPGYDMGGLVLRNAVAALGNALRLRIPVWVQATIERLDQIQPVLGLIEKYRKIIFNITIRSVRPYGRTDPDAMVHVSDIVRFLGKERDYQRGNHPFNHHVKLHGRTAKLCSWVNDRRRVDPHDATYVIHNDAIVPFHKGMILDDIHFRTSVCAAER